MQEAHAIRPCHRGSDGRTHHERKHRPQEAEIDSLREMEYAEAIALCEEVSR